MPSEVTQLLERASQGDESALDELLPLVYGELRRRASAQMRGERSAHTLGTTGLVHEAVMRLANQKSAQWADSQHFYAVASMTMRRILVNWARDRQRIKRGAGKTKISLNGIDVAGREPEPETVLAVDSALVALAAQSERAVRIVECRYFAGLSIEETASALEVSTATVKREWRMARAWLRERLEGAAAQSAGAG